MAVNLKHAIRKAQSKRSRERAALKAGDPVRLVQEPERKGTVAHVYERGVLHVSMHDGTSELVLPEDLEQD